MHLDSNNDIYNPLKVKYLMIVCERLTKYFGQITAIKDLSIRIPDGQVFGLLGPNGAGKTTTMRMLACLIKPSFGSARIGDLEIGPEKNNLKIRSHIGLLPETPGLYDSLGAYKNLDFYAQFFDISKSKREENIKTILKNLKLWERRHTPVGEFSKGMKQKIAIARALIHEPKYIFLDEPTASLDPQAAKTVREYILELKSKGNTILINTHNLNEAERVCDRVALLKNRMVKVGKPKELAQGLFGRNIKVTLDRFPKSITEKILAFNYVTEAKIQNNQLVLNVKNPEEDNNKIITWLMAQGLKVQFISEEEYSLEDVYLKLIGEEAGGQ
jgi:ABC-2 type transport system ATP-binding protein